MARPWILQPNTTIQIWTGCSAGVIPGFAGETQVYGGDAQQLLPRAAPYEPQFQPTIGPLFQRFVILWPIATFISNEIPVNAMGQVVLLGVETNVGALIIVDWHIVMDMSYHQQGATPPGVAWKPDVAFLYAQRVQCN